MNHKHQNGWFFWLIFFILIFLSSCTKQGLIRCGTVVQMKKIYNNTAEWKYLRSEEVFNFGVQCGADLEFYQGQAKDTNQLCFEPVKLYWIIKLK